MSVSLILLIIAFICFLLATVNWPAVPINLTALGLAMWVLSILIGRGIT